MGAWVDLSGRTFERLTVISYEGASMWLCRCACGTVKPVKAKYLKNGGTKSCGCWSIDRIRELRRKRKQIHKCACGDHVFTNLTRGFVGLLSPEDRHFFEANAWCAHRSTRNAWSAMGSRNRKLHREVLGTQSDIDHANRNPFDNRRSNLRPCSQSENGCNKARGRRTWRSRFKGVTPQPRSSRNPWLAQIAVNRRHIYLGCFPTEEAAARAYDKAAQRLHGEFACTNVSLGLLPPE